MWGSGGQAPDRAAAVGLRPRLTCASVAGQVRTAAAAERSDPTDPEGERKEGMRWRGAERRGPLMSH